MSTAAIDLSHIYGDFVAPGRTRRGDLGRLFPYECAKGVDTVNSRPAAAGLRTD